MSNSVKTKNRMNRRGFLNTCVGLSAGLILPEAFAKSSHEHERVLSLFNTHTGEKVTATYWAEGQYIHDEVKAIEWLLRDHRVGKAHTMDMRVLNILHAIQSRVNNARPYHIISGYRSPETNEMLRRRSSGVDKNSYHILGRAIDIRLPRFDTSNLRKVAVSLQAGGVGYYPRSNFVHVDTGKIRTW